MGVQGLLIDVLYVAIHAISFPQKDIPSQWWWC